MNKPTTAQLAAAHLREQIHEGRNGSVVWIQAADAEALCDAIETCTARDAALHAQRSKGGTATKDKPRKRILAGQEERIADMIRAGMIQGKIAGIIGVTSGALTNSPVWAMAKKIAESENK